MGKVREIAEMTAWYLQEIRKDPKARDSKEEALAAIEAGEALITLSKSRGATTLKELIKEVKRMTKVGREEMILPWTGSKEASPTPRTLGDSCWRRRPS